MIAPIGRRLLQATLIIAAMLAATTSGHAKVLPPKGWVVLKTKHTYADLINEVNKAAKANKIGVVTRASATVGAKKVLNRKIPGNMVVGLYHPRFAVRMLEASITAGIEAPIRVYLTENGDGSADLSYKKPSEVFAPYMKEGGEKLKALAAELDELFAKLTRQAAGM